MIVTCPKCKLSREPYIRSDQEKLNDRNNDFKDRIEPDARTGAPKDSFWCGNCYERNDLNNSEAYFTFSLSRIKGITSTTRFSRLLE